MFNKTYVMPLLFLLLFFISELSYGDSNRTLYPTGLALDFLGDPYLSLGGGSFNYRPNDWIGFDASASVFWPAVGAGVKLFVPELNFTPTVGFNYSHHFAEYIGPESTSQSLGLTRSERHPPFYITAYSLLFNLYRAN